MGQEARHQRCTCHGVLWPLLLEGVTHRLGVEASAMCWEDTQVSGDLLPHRAGGEGLALGSGQPPAGNGAGSQTPATCWWHEELSERSLCTGRAHGSSAGRWPSACSAGGGHRDGAAPQGKPSSPGAAFHLWRERATQERGLQRSPQVTQRGLLSLYFDAQVHIRTRGFLISEVPTAAQERIAWHLGVVSQEAGEAPRHPCPSVCAVGLRATPAPSS